MFYPGFVVPQLATAGKRTPGKSGSTPDQEISFFLLGPLMLYAWFPLSSWLKPEVLESKKLRIWLVVAVGLLVSVFAAYMGFFAELF